MPVDCGSTPGPRPLTWASLADPAADSSETVFRAAASSPCSCWTCRRPPASCCCQSSVAGNRQQRHASCQIDACLPRAAGLRGCPCQADGCPPWAAGRQPALQVADTGTCTHPRPHRQGVCSGTHPAAPSGRDSLQPACCSCPPACAHRRAAAAAWPAAECESLPPLRRRRRPQPLLLQPAGPPTPPRPAAAATRGRLTFRVRIIWLQPAGPPTPPRPCGSSHARAGAADAARLACQHVQPAYQQLQHASLLHSRALG